MAGFGYEYNTHCNTVKYGAVVLTIFYIQLSRKFRGSKIRWLHTFTCYTELAYRDIAVTIITLYHFNLNITD